MTGKGGCWFLRFSERVSGRVSGMRVKVALVGGTTNILASRLPISFGNYNSTKQSECCQGEQGHPKDVESTRLEVHRKARYRA